MRVLYIDIDSLRPDHLGCYGYGRRTSPNIDALAAGGVRFDHCYITDAPCLPSRTALWSGRCGFHTGVVNHGGTAAQPFVEGPTRGFSDLFGTTGWMAALRQAGLRTATISSFGERHSAWHWYAGYNEIHNPGRRGMEIADEVSSLALDWLQRHARADDWFLHVNYWDPHTPYRTPAAFGNPFADDAPPAWLTDQVWRRAWEGFGPHSPQEPFGFADETLAHEFAYRRFPGNPDQIDSPATMRRWIDSYDTGIRYADEHVGHLLNALADAGVLDETLVMVSADHGENQGELNVWGDHQTADAITCRVPLIVRMPGARGEARVDSALHYHFDWAATLIELAGGEVPANWDGVPFTAAFRTGREAGRPFLVTSQQAWACQRGVRFDQYLLLRSYHDGYKDLEPVMLWDLSADPHEQHDLAPQRPDLVERGLGLLATWYGEMALSGRHDADPMMTVLREGGPLHTRGMLPNYLARLRATGRAHHAERLAGRHPRDV
ncbi:MAG: Sulfatase [uncultured Thermomicrobiales bacterium]|uniref:Sulfatase n=1 Tax=uncultured Thermomicrobiales bacterium TaxID=1645740 RepID=A0A6J4V9V6_9BACT|nr:MAG: Sulfatase [uncultured Thermomicrobiales bacterium]